MTQASYVAARQNYREAASSRTKIQLELTRVREELKLLAAENVTMVSQSTKEWKEPYFGTSLTFSQAEIKKVLSACIGTLVAMKGEISKLVSFFDALSALTEHLVKDHVQKFILQAENARKSIMGNYSLSDVVREQLYITSLMCQAYFSIFKDFAAMYVTISKDHIMPGVDLCDKLSMSLEQPGAVAERTARLQQFSDAAEKAIKDKVNEVSYSEILLTTSLNV